MKHPRDEVINLLRTQARRRERHPYGKGALLSFQVEVEYRTGYPISRKETITVRAYNFQRAHLAAFLRFERARPRFWAGGGEIEEISNTPDEITLIRRWNQAWASRNRDLKRREGGYWQIEQEWSDCAHEMRIGRRLLSVGEFNRLQAKSLNLNPTRANLLRWRHRWQELCVKALLTPTHREQQSQARRKALEHRRLIMNEEPEGETNPIWMHPWRGAGDPAPTYNLDKYDQAPSAVA